MTQPHSIIFCDIDGCLNDGKHIGFDLAGLGIIRTQIKHLAARGIALSLCTGRPQPYAEAMAQALDLRTPFICEYGAMVFDPVTDEAISLLHPKERAEIDRLRQHLLTLVGDGNKHVLEPGKDFALSITGPGIVGAENAAIEAQMQAYRAQCDGFDVAWTYSISAIDISPKGISKQTGAAYLLERFSIDQSAAFAIGDSVGDIPVLSFVGQPMCPANAALEVKKICGMIAASATTQGVAEILESILDRP